MIILTEEQESRVAEYQKKLKTTLAAKLGSFENYENSTETREAVEKCVSEYLASIGPIPYTVECREVTWHTMYPKTLDRVLARLADLFIRAKILRRTSNVQHWYHTVFPFHILYTAPNTNWESDTLDSIVVEKYRATLETPYRHLDVAITLRPVVVTTTVEEKQ